ncbi:MAG: hypothetical protein Q9198_008698, partial [Flavoplaca austrocitrina]
MQESEPGRCLRVFRDCLSEDTSHYILQLPREALTEDELATLSKIYLRFNPAPVSLSETTNPGEDQDTTRPEDNTHQTRKNTPGTVDTEAINVDEGEEVIPREGEGPTMQNNAAINKTAPLVLAKRSQSASNNDHDPTPKKRGRPSKGLPTKAPKPQSQSWGNILILKELKLQNDVEQHL